MSLLEFAKGPAIEWALIIFTAGIFFRLAVIFIFTRKKPLSVARKERKLTGFRTIFSRIVPYAVFRKRLGGAYIASATWHFGFLVILFLLPAHILFFKGLFGISWPGISHNVAMPIAGLSLALLCWSLINRFIHPVQKKISKLGDFLTLIVTILPLLTGLMASAHLLVRYETMLSIHLLSVCLFLIWFPFSKLMHVILFIPSRKRLGDKLGYKGVKA